MQDLLSIEAWGLGLHSPLTIAGPCSAESAAQVSQTLDLLAEQSVDVFRAGIWKPRTRPNSFEGVGTVGLKWLKDAGLKHGKPVCVEVANVKHVHEALAHGIDILWVGARTTTNPFAVQEIADALEGIDIPVIVKNPVNPDLELWIGAIERLYRAGITKLAAIHRGFSTYDKSKYRNRPHWEIPIELRRRLPELPLLCDPSHICGRRDLIPGVAQEALDLNFDGLMIESHVNPDVALSDAKQQLTPAALSQVLASLVYRQPDTEDPIFHNKLERFRGEIDKLDREWIDILSKRMEIVREIGHYKKANNVAILQAARWNEIIETRLAQGIPLDLGENFLLTLLQSIHSESIRNQAHVMNGAEEVIKVQ